MAMTTVGQDADCVDGVELPIVRVEISRVSSPGERAQAIQPSPRWWAYLWAGRFSRYCSQRTSSNMNLKLGPKNKVAAL
ncbi:hypothetical protein CG716_03605 [Mycolicibacterium sphagni]|uniref:Uncharacterized protein n=1 Tax=Mycolicibacterium sphagni TaxID=1786 RepID=A0A255DUH9_9MYCO|nr:hypothetical protein CG716_03605 [Mycolicibacterium sphagni]